jgi:O-antigen/teichoic acid export membrane protein
MISLQTRLDFLRRSSSARSSLKNSLYGTGEYVALPLILLLATPFLLHRLGLAQFGLWMLASAAVTSSSLISAGFGDGALKYAATYRGDGDRRRLEHTLRVNLTINLALGGVLAAALWCGSPYAAESIFKIDSALRSDAIAAFRIGSAILLVRCFESVLTGALRAHERYGPAAQINVLSRAAIILAACILAARGHGIVAIMTATLCGVTASSFSQVLAVHALIGRIWLLPSFDRGALSEVLSYGCFSWLQALSGCIFNQADRLLIGALLGAASVGYYSVCVQAAQPIHGLIAAGLHFLFPHLSARLARASAPELRRVVLSALQLNALAAAGLCIPLVFFSNTILRLWMGEPFASRTWPLLSIIALGFGLLALNVTGHYTLLALAQVRLVAMLNLAGGAAMLLVMFFLIPRFGLTGAAMGRLVYGPITLLMYGRLRVLLSPAGQLLAGVPPSFAVAGNDSP